MSARKQSGSGVPPLDSTPEVGRVAPNAPWPVVPLHSIAQHHSGNSKLIKGKLHSAPGDNLFAAYSASGQDVWRSEAEHEGDAIIISAVGARCGKCFIARGRWSAIANTHVVWPDLERVDLKFLWYQLNNEQFWIRSGSAQPFVAVRKTFEKEVTLPPLPEQRRIVAEIEAQFTKLDAGVAALKRVQANLKRYRAAVLKAACEGKLVPTEAELRRTEGRRPKTASIPREGATSPAGVARGVQEVGSSSLTGPTAFETGEQLLQRILVERRKTWQGRGKYKEPVAPDTSNLPPLPKSWTWASVDQMTGHITSGSRDWSQYYGKGTGTFVLAQNVRPMRLDMTERQTVDAPAGDAETERTRVVQDDLLVTIVGAKTGDVCRVPHELNDHFVCQSVGLLRPVSASTARYLELYLASPENGQAIWKRFIYGQGRPHLGFDELRATAVALPSVAEQTRIVAEVERRLSVIDELETLAATNLARATRLRQAVLQQPFGGVPYKGA